MRQLCNKYLGLGALFLPIVLIATLALMLMAGDHAPPPPLASIHDVAATVDMRGLPRPSFYQARDGQALAYRAYPGAGPLTAVLVHGSAGSSRDMHALAYALRTSGVATYAIDIRGHGLSGPKGDITYVGQLEDDLSDFVAYLRRSGLNRPLVLVGHSSGGGFALRVAGSPIGASFSRVVLLAPYLRHDAPTSRGIQAGGWAKPFVPRIIALTLLGRLGIHAFDGLPVVAFAIDPRAKDLLTAQYSFRLFDNFRPHDDYQGDVKRSTTTMVVQAGTDDEVFNAARYSEALGGNVRVELINGVGHMGMISDPRALARVTNAVFERTGTETVLTSRP